MTPGNDDLDDLDDLDPIDAWPTTGLAPLDDLDDDPEDTEDELPELPELPDLTALPALSALDLAEADPEADHPIPELPTPAADAVQELGPQVVVLPWQTEATVDGAPCAAVLHPSERTSTLHDPAASSSRRTVTIRLGPVTQTLDIRVVAQGPTVLHAGRDVLGGQILVSSDTP